MRRRNQESGVRNQEEERRVHFGRAWYTKGLAVRLPAGFIFSKILMHMEIQGRWKKDPEGYMEFEDSRLQRYYELVTNDYYQVYNHYLDKLDDEEAASTKARQQGYQMITDYKTIEGTKEFATTFVTPGYVLDVWYDFDPVRNKRDYERGSMSIRTKEEA